MGNRGELAVFAARSGQQFGERVVRELSDIFKANQEPYLKEGMETELGLWRSSSNDFRNGEIDVKITDNVRGKDVYLVQCCDDPSSERSLNDNLFEMLLYIDALKRGKPGNLTLVVPNYPYARKDAASGREPISSKLIADFIAGAGADNIIMVDLHSKQGQASFDRAMGFDNLDISNLTAEYLTSYFRGQMKDIVIVSPDAGGAKRVRNIATQVGCRWSISEKSRLEAGEVDKIYLLGEVREKRVVLLDDMVDSGGTAEKAVMSLYDKGAKDIMIYCTHALLSDPATAIFSSLHAQGKMVKLVGTDTVPRSKDYLLANPWFEQIKVAPLVANVIYRINHELSVSEIFQQKPNGKK